MARKGPLRVSRFFVSPYWPALLSGLVVPGLGQIANRDFRKGIVLIGCSLGAFFWFSEVVTEELTRFLPGTPDQWLQDQGAMREALVQLVNENPGMFLTFHLLVILAWGFGVVDAFLTARQRLRERAKGEQP